MIVAMFEVAKMKMVVDAEDSEDGWNDIDDIEWDGMVDIVYTV